MEDANPNTVVSFLRYSWCPSQLAQISQRLFALKRMHYYHRHFNDAPV